MNAPSPPDGRERGTSPWVTGGAVVRGDRAVTARTSRDGLLVRHQHEVLVHGCGRAEQQARGDRLPAGGAGENDGETIVEAGRRVLAVLVRTGVEELAAV